MCRTGVRTIDTGRTDGRRCRLGEAAPSACASSEDHRDGQPRRTGRLHHHLQIRALRTADQGRRLHLGEAFERRPRLALGHGIALAGEDPHAVGAGDAQVDADQNACGSSRLLRSSRFHRLARRGVAVLGHGPKEPRPTDGSHSSAANGSDLQGSSQPSSGASVAAPGVAIRRTRPDPHGRPSRKARFDMDRWEAFPQGQGLAALPVAIFHRRCGLLLVVRAQATPRTRTGGIR